MAGKHSYFTGPGGRGKVCRFAGIRRPLRASRRRRNVPKVPSAGLPILPEGAPAGVAGPAGSEARSRMNDSKAILNKIAALRRGQEEGGPVQQLERKVSSGFRQNLVLDGS